MNNGNFRIMELLRPYELLGYSLKNRPEKYGRYLEFGFLECDIQEHL